MSKQHEKSQSTSVSTDVLAFSSAQDIAKHLKCHPVTSRVLWSRGVRSTDELKEIFTPKLSDLPDPLCIADMKKAVERVKTAIEKKEKITVYGDYDVDGTCGSALLFEFFKQVGVDICVYQPDRFKEGYGVNLESVKKLCEEGTKVLISVDCGITAFDPAMHAREQGVDFIVLDHHKVQEKLPDAFAVVNPQRDDCDSGLKTVCGTGIAFFFIVALRAELRASGFFETHTEPNLKSFLDLVAVATIADMMDVRGVNRILLTHGLEVLEKSPRIGLKALLTAAQITKPTGMHCGFVLGPRINAAGRLKHARYAFELLTSSNADAAFKAAEELEKLNTARKFTQDEVVMEALKQAKTVMANPKWEELAKDIPAASFGPWPRALVLANPSWHEGVVGIVATRVVEEFKRPVFILCRKEDCEVPTLKGSVRSYAKIDIISHISSPQVAKHLTNFGGHAHAGGVTLLQENLDAFVEDLNLEMALTTDEAQYRKEVFFDTEVKISEIDSKLVSELQGLGPFGQGYPEPVLKVNDAKADRILIMKEKHLKLSLSDSDLAMGSKVPDAVWFGALSGSDESVNRFEKLKNKDRFSFFIQPGFNEWQGVKRLQLRILSSVESQ